jgi:hypothetical protein
MTQCLSYLQKLQDFTNIYNIHTPGDVQFAVLLWDVWVGEGKPTPAVLQQGRHDIFVLSM